MGAFDWRKVTYLGGAQSWRVQSSSVPTYVLPRHVTLTTKTPAAPMSTTLPRGTEFFFIFTEFLVDIPPSVSCQTMPSSVTAVPGSHGPRHSGSVMVDALHVPTQASLRANDDDDDDDDDDAEVGVAAPGLDGCAPFTKPFLRRFIFVHTTFEFDCFY